MNRVSRLLILLLFACTLFIPQVALVSAKEAKPKGKGAKKKAADHPNSLRKTADKLAMLEQIHKSFPASKIGGSLVFTSEDLDKNLKQRIAADDKAYAPIISDEGFLRRVSLDLTGRLPEPDAIKQFIADSNPKKRSQLIDRLLESPEYAQHWGHYWRTVVLHNAPAKKKQLNPQALEDWFAEEFEQNTGWDRIVSELLAATPKKPKKGADNGPQDYGPNNFALAFENEPEEIASQTARLFMSPSPHTSSTTPTTTGLPAPT